MKIAVVESMLLFLNAFCYTKDRYRLNIEEKIAIRAKGQQNQKSTQFPCFELLS